MKEHKYHWLSTYECKEHAVPFDFWTESLYWCENCGIVKKVREGTDQVYYYIPVGYGSKPNSQECVDAVDNS